MHLGAGQIKRFRDERHGGGADTTELFLQAMQDRKHGASGPACSAIISLARSAFQAEASGMRSHPFCVLN